MSRDNEPPPPSGEGSEPCPITLFRLGLVELVLFHVRCGTSVAQAAARVAATPHPDHRGVLRRVSPRSLRRWVGWYRSHGSEGLRPRPREKATGPVVLSPKLVAFLVEEKIADPEASVPEVIARARTDGFLRPGESVCRSTVNRTLKRMGISLSRRRSAAERDSRCFEFPHRLDALLCDGKHFRAGPKSAKRVALNFLDDATRKYLGVSVGPSESTETFLHGLFPILLRYGLPGLLYLDKGPGFISLDTKEVLRQLGIPFLYGETRYPEAHGKVEKFNQTLLRDVLRQFPGAPDVDPRYAALELRIDHYRTRIYNVREHEGLEGETPADRFARDTKPLELRAPTWLEERFVLHERRRVSNHHLVKSQGKRYEVPWGLAGSWVTVQRRILEGNRLLLPFEGKLIELHEVDTVANARARRGRHQDRPSPEVGPRPRTAAGRAFARDFGSVLDLDGGFRERTGSESEGDGPLDDHDEDLDNEGDTGAPGEET